MTPLEAFHTGVWHGISLTFAGVACIVSVAVAYFTYRK